eukprot:TRINITY_DN3008_c0_g1_i2.p1 TRINITY_DN3008_c0_g1~~TRINITY_DN3008_c0_g1_i2.p1  ORF type:complete len:611 (-),score=88.58 TRINITY_DN3008_c0_g1_i2:1434-3266(-)
MEITTDVEWSSFLNSRGLDLLSKKLKNLSSILQSNKVKKQLTEDLSKSIETIKTDAYVKYEIVEEYSNCEVLARSVKSLGTTDAVYFLIPHPGAYEIDLINVGMVATNLIKGMEPAIKGLDGKCVVHKGWSIGKDLDEKQTIWTEQFVDIKRIYDGETIYKAVHKFWKYVPNDNIWGEGYTEKLLGNGRKSTAHEVWRDNAQERFRDFWVEQSLVGDSRCLYSYGQKEAFASVGADRVIDRWEKKAEGTDTDFEYNEKYTVTLDGRSWGTKDGKKGTENFHEKWSVINEEKITEKWSDQPQADDILKKWGEKVKDQPDGTQHVEKWWEIHKSKENYIERHVNKHTLTPAGLKYGENYFENSAKKVWHEKWEEHPDRKIITRYEDDGFGHKSQETTGIGFGECQYDFKDNYYENVPSNERYTEKRGYSAIDGNKWVCKIHDNPEKNYVEKTTDKWVEKWFDDKKGIKWASKEGSKANEGKEWKENWHEKRAGPGDHQPPIEKTCEKWGKENQMEWLEKWREEYDSGICKYKFCEKTHKENDTGYHRGYRVVQHAKGEEKDGKRLWWYKVEGWENEKYKVKEFEQYEQFLYLNLQTSQQNQCLIACIFTMHQ